MLNNLNNFRTILEQFSNSLLNNLNKIRTIFKQLLNTVNKFTIVKTIVETMFNVQNNVSDLTVLAGSAEALKPFNLYLYYVNCAHVLSQSNSYWTCLLICIIEKCMYNWKVCFLVKVFCLFVVYFQIVFANCFKHIMSKSLQIYIYIHCHIWYVQRLKL